MYELRVLLHFHYPLSPVLRVCFRDSLKTVLCASFKSLMLGSEMDVSKHLN
jgi:hypothetical protein